MNDAAWEGEDVRGALDYDGDIDYFHMIALSGRTYQIDVTLGTVDNSIVKLYDEDGALLDSNDDYGGTLASRLYWEAPSVNDYEHYIAVEGYGIGTYTLMVSIVDDHSSDFESATRIAIGESVRIVLHNYDDRDVLVFSARPGTKYVFTLDNVRTGRRGEAAGTIMVLYDAGGRVLARLRGCVRSLGHVLEWRYETQTIPQRPDRRTVGCSGFPTPISQDRGKATYCRPTIGRTRSGFSGPRRWRGTWRIGARECSMRVPARGWSARSWPASASAISRRWTCHPEC